MPEPLIIREVRLYPLAIPMRLRFEHAAASREVADPVLVRVTAAAPYADLVGWGETLARPYVTGETATSVVSDLIEQLLPRLGGFRPRSFPEALEFIEDLPLELDDRVVHAARTALELALLDLAGRAFHRRASDAAGWLGLPGFGAPGCLAHVRYSGVVVGSSRQKLSWLLPCPAGRNGCAGRGIHYDVRWNAVMRRCGWMPMAAGRWPRRATPCRCSSRAA
jgi:hypothetical protein